MEKFLNILLCLIIFTGLCENTIHATTIDTRNYIDNIININFVPSGGSSGNGDLTITYINETNVVESFIAKEDIITGFEFKDINNDGRREIVNYQNILFNFVDNLSNAHEKMAAFPVIYSVDTINKQLVDISVQNINWYKNEYMPLVVSKIEKVWNSEEEYEFKEKYALVSLYILIDEFTKGNVTDLNSFEGLANEAGIAIKNPGTAFQYYELLLGKKPSYAMYEDYPQVPDFALFAWDQSHFVCTIDRRQFPMHTIYYYHNINTKYDEMLDYIELIQSFGFKENISDTKANGGLPVYRKGNISICLAIFLDKNTLGVSIVQQE